MPDILVRNLDRATVDELRTRAKRKHRSVQGEVRSILAEAAPSRAVACGRLIHTSNEMLEMTRANWDGDNAALIREDREPH